MGSSFNIQTDSLDDYLTVKTAADMSGYNQQYLRRLLRGNILPSKRFGQLWLIERNGFIDYLIMQGHQQIKGLAHSKLTRYQL